MTFLSYDKLGGMIMKKLVLITLCLLMPFLLAFEAQASHYLGYERIEMSSGKLLADFTDKEYKTYYKKVKKLKFDGWRVYIVNDNTKASFISETLFSYYNDGYTPIEYEYKLERKRSQKIGLSSTGSIGLKSTETIPKFKNNLDAALKLSSEYIFNEEEKETYYLKFLVDPGTQVDLYVYGEGKVTNGVAARYSFFIRVAQGGFEIFVVTTEYQRLEKKKI
jgi:hypothetical protein